VVDPFLLVGNLLSNPASNRFVISRRKMLTAKGVEKTGVLSCQISGGR